MTFSTPNVGLLFCRLCIRTEPSTFCDRWVTSLAVVFFCSLLSNVNVVSNVPRLSPSEEQARVLVGPSMCFAGVYNVSGVVCELIMSCEWFPLRQLICKGLLPK
jgi:hypothetical protein